MKPAEPIDDAESPEARKDRLASCDMLRATEKAFRDWLAEGDNAAALDLRRIKHRSRRCAYHFAGIYPGIQLWIRSSGYDITVEDEDGKCWDMFVSDDCVVAQREDGSFYCRLVLEPNDESLPTREAVWRNHLFEPLRKWVEQTLRCSHTLVLAGEGGFSYAFLEPGRESRVMARRVIPLRTNEGAEGGGA